MIKRNIKPYILRLALDVGFVKGNRDYVRFIILGRSRTGSEYLKGLLSSHTQIVNYGELFQKQDYVNYDFQGFYQSRKKQELLQKDPVVFLENEIFRIYPERVGAVGFKIFYYHAKNDPWRKVWTYLQNLTDLKIIHIKRKNILETHLSQKRAASSGSWINLSGKKEFVGPINLSFEDCQDDFKRTREWENFYENFFGVGNRLDIYYEDLLKDGENQLQRIQRHLCLDEEKLYPKTYKQRTEPMSEVVANYYELKEKFRDTPWAEFFVE